jgi:hypothetical protein
MTLVFKVSLKSGKCILQKKTFLSIRLEILFLVFYLYFMWLCSSIFFPFKFYTNLYIIFLFKLIIIFFCKFCIEFREMIMRESFLSLCLL